MSNSVYNNVQRLTKGSYRPGSFWLTISLYATDITIESVQLEPSQYGTGRVPWDLVTRSFSQAYKVQVCSFKVGLRELVGLSHSDLPI